MTVEVAKHTISALTTSMLYTVDAQGQDSHAVTQPLAGALIFLARDNLELFVRAIHVLLEFFVTNCREAMVDQLEKLVGELFE